MNRPVFLVAVLCAMAAVGGLLFLVARPPAPALAPAVEGPPPADPAPPPAVPEPPADIANAPRPEPVPEGAVPAPPPAVPDVGTLRIDSDVAGAQVFIDRQFIGEAPVTARNIAPGTHRLNVEAPGFDGVVQSIEVQPGERDVFVPLREVRLEAAIAVEHRHRIGSCLGQLVATPEGLRYAPTEGDDDFSVALADLETFEVDYLERNLRVTVRGGRQYTFTDPDGDADRLFVFHRDVDRARQRLARGDPPAGG